MTARTEGRKPVVAPGKGMAKYPRLHCPPLPPKLPSLEVLVRIRRMGFLGFEIAGLKQGQLVGQCGET